MSRRIRGKSTTGIYHIILRGTNRQEIFHDDEDQLRFLETIERFKRKCNIKVHGWCLMGNHIHLLLGEGNESISTTMKRIGVSFAAFYNQKYDALGHLFQDRFRSEEVEDEKYLLTVIRYIHQNPVKAGMVRNPADWSWSSCSGYYGQRYYPPGLLDDELILSLFSDENQRAIERFIEFNELSNEDKCLDNSGRKKITDSEAREEIKRIAQYELTEIKGLPKAQRDKIILKLKDIEGISQRQIARVLGISTNLVFKI